LQTSVAHEYLADLRKLEAEILKTIERGLEHQGYRLPNIDQLEGQVPRVVTGHPRSRRICMKCCSVSHCLCRRCRQCDGFRMSLGYERAHTSGGSVRRCDKACRSGLNMGGTGRHFVQISGGRRGLAAIDLNAKKGHDLLRWSGVK